VDALVRRRRALLSGAASAALLVACAGGRGSGAAVGLSDKPAGGATVRDGGGPAFVDGAGALPAGYRETFTKLNKARFVSQGHAAGRWEVDVWANEIAAKAMAERAREVPVGAVVVEEHWERFEGKTPGPVMLMEKRPAGFAPEHGDWRWAVVGSRGQLVQDGVIDSCAGCHDDAPMDGLFPIVE
jgi:hypothetical protein